VVSHGIKYGLWLVGMQITQNHYPLVSLLDFSKFITLQITKWKVV